MVGNRFWPESLSTHLNLMGFSLGRFASISTLVVAIGTFPQFGLVASRPTTHLAVPQGAEVRVCDVLPESGANS